MSQRYDLPNRHAYCSLIFQQSSIIISLRAECVKAAVKVLKMPWQKNAVH